MEISEEKQEENRKFYKSIRMTHIENKARSLMESLACEGLMDYILELEAGRMIVKLEEK